MRIKIEKFDRRIDAVIGCAALAFALGSAAALYFLRDQVTTFVPNYFLLFFTTFVGSSTIFLPSLNIPVILFHASALPPLFVIIAAGLGSGLGEITGYAAGSLGRLSITELSPRFEVFLGRFQFISIFALACVPNPIFDIVGVLAGSLRVPWGKFLLAAVFGRLVQAALLVSTATEIEKLIN